MGFIDKMDNKVKHMSSKRSESSAVNGILKNMEEENVKMKELIEKLGQHFWALYKEDKLYFNPDDDARQILEMIKECTDNLRGYSAQIDDTRMKGIQEREVIDENTRKTIEEKERMAEIKRKEKEEARIAKLAEKESRME